MCDIHLHTRVPLFCFGAPLTNLYHLLHCCILITTKISLHVCQSFTMPKNSTRTCLPGMSRQLRLCKTVSVCRCGASLFLFPFPDCHLTTPSTPRSLPPVFWEANKFNGDISPWTVSRVTSMRYMFYETRLFNRDISYWDVSSVADMAYRECTSSTLIYQPPHSPDD